MIEVADPSTALGSLADEWRREWSRLRARADPKAVHRMRTATRRLRTAETIAADRLGIAAVTPWDEWTGVARRLGGLRDLDVRLAELRAVSGKLPPRATRAIQRTLAALELDRDRRARAIRRRLRRRRARRLARAIRKSPEPWSRSPVERVTAEAWWNATIEPFLADRAWSLDPATAIARQATRRELHRLRFGARAIRYGLEWWDRLGFEPTGDAMDFVKAVQEILGRLRDLRGSIRAARGRPLAEVRHRLRSAIAGESRRWAEVAVRREALRSSPFGISPAGGFPPSDRSCRLHRAFRSAPVPFRREQPRRIRCEPVTAQPPSTS